MQPLSSLTKAMLDLATTPTDIWRTLACPKPEDLAQPACSRDTEVEAWNLRGPDEPIA